MPVQILLMLTRVYHYISPVWGSSCRFHPSCSYYADEAWQRYGFWKGTRLAIGRILRCHPWNPGGVDQVP